MGRMVVIKALEMMKRKRVKPSSDTIEVMMQREGIPATGAYATVKSTPSSIYDPSSHVLEYKSYSLSMSVGFNLKYILGLSIFVFGGNKEHKNGALNGVHFSILSYLKNFSRSCNI